MKMKKTLIVIDMQHDFVDGALGTKEAVAIVSAVKEKIETRKEEGYEILYTRDTHYEDYLNTSEGKYLPVEHCIKGTWGWQIMEELELPGCEIIDKETFGYNGWAGREFDHIELVGLCTDICVVTNGLILKTMYPNAVIAVDATCCAGVTPESHEAALKTMSMCQIEVTGLEK